MLSATTSTIALLSSAVTADNDGDGYIDRVVATFSKDLDGSTVTGADFSVAGHTVASASETSAGVVTIVLTEESTYNTGATPLISIAGSVSDTAGNVTTSSSVSAADGAVSRIVSITPAADAVVTRTTNIVVTFTEAMNTSSVATSFTPVSVSLTPVWTVGNTVMTLTHASLLSAGQQHSLTITAAEDTAGNAFGGILSGSHPRTFRATSASQTTVTTSTSSTSTIAPTITVLTPNGGEALVPGDRQEISWSTTGSGLAVVALAYSIDDGASYIAIDTVANLGFFTWTVPNVDTDTVRILAQAGDLSATLAQDASDAVFTILGSATRADTNTVTDDASDTSDVTLAVVVVDSGMGISPYTGEAESVTEVAVGDYIRSPNFSTVYFVDADGMRRPFMDAQTYFTYEDSFAVVKTVTDATLPQLALGAPMLPKAGVVLVKIISDPRVYWVSDEDGVATLRWIVSEAIAEDMLGTDWSEYVIDVPPTMIGRYTRGADLTSPLTLSLSSLRSRMTIAAMAMPR